MAISVIARPNNRLVASPHYGNILREYNERHAKDGSVNEKKFYEEVVAALIPDYKIGAWYKFIHRFKTTAGLVVANVVANQQRVPAGPEEEKLSTALLSNESATQIGIKSALNLGAKALDDLINNPHLLSPKDRADILFKAMKAQDSRIHAIGKIREDNREEEKFNRAFSDANY